MSAEENDPLVNRAIDELRRLPPLDREAVQRVVQAAAAARLTPAADDEQPVEARRTRSIRIWSAVGLAAAAAIAGFVAGDLRVERKEPVETTAVAPTAAVATPGRQVARDPGEVVAIPQQFVFDNKTARRVSVVGDFNNWNPSANPMTRDAAGVWVVVVPILPGRHLYGYMINDSVFTLDPRKQKARDPDLGSEGSVLMVGRP